MRLQLPVLLMALSLGAWGAKAQDAQPVSVPALKLPGAYQLRPGDSLSLAFRLSPELNQTVTVDTDGSVSLELIGRLELQGLTIDEARRLIISKESEHLLRPEINVQLTNPQRTYVVVAGEVNQPQRIELRDNLTALEAVMLAGGVRISGSQTNVLLYRKINAEYAEVHKLNLKIHQTAALEQDLMLQPGDLIVVSRSKVESVARYTRIVGLGYNFDPRGF